MLSDRWCGWFDSGVIGVCVCYVVYSLLLSVVCRWEDMKGFLNGKRLLLWVVLCVGVGVLVCGVWVGCVD